MEDMQKPASDGDLNGQRRVRKHVLSKLYGKSMPEKTVGLDECMTGVSRMLRDTVTLRRGDSCVLVGPHGSGKTLVVRRCVEKLESEFPGQVLVVWLNSLLLLDDRMAIREAARQLDKRIGGNQTIEKVSISLTTQSLMQLFERAAMEVAEAKAEAEDSATNGIMNGSPSGTVESPTENVRNHHMDTTYDSNTDMMVDSADKSMNGSNPDSVSVVFIVEGIDRYATGLRQTLLYLLFGLAQESPIGVSVIGTTTRVNMDEMFEKRVRSRFSQRYFSVARPRTHQEFLDVAKALLRVDDTTLPAEVWHQYIDSELASENSQLSEIIRSAYHTSKNPRLLAAQLAPLIALTPLQLPPSGMVTSDPSRPKAEDLTKIATAATLLRGMPELDWAILICAARARTRYEDVTDCINLVLVMDEYRMMTRELQRERTAGLGFGGYRAWSARAVRHTWERLQRVELIVPANASSSTGRSDLTMYRPETDLQDLRGLLSSDHALYSWTQL